MLIKFSVENWQSFRDEATISLIASKERQHQDRLAKIDKYKIRLLPTAAIYGGNASGKTKFYNAIEFAKKFIITVTQPQSAIPREYFRLDKQCASKPSSFCFEILIEDIYYEFSFSVTQKEVVNEKLVEISRYSEKVLYQREQGKKIIFPDDVKLKSDQRLQFVAEGTRENQLFLTTTINQKINHFQAIYNWFKHQLILINPASTYINIGQFIQEDHPVYASMNDTLAQLDTGIIRLGGIDIPLESLQIPEEIKTKLLEDMPDGGSAAVLQPNGRIVITKKNGAITTKRLVAYHKMNTGNETSFEMKQESAGTLRTIDLLPSFYDLKQHTSSKTYFIDEINRCLHTMMTRSLIENYLQSCSATTRSQLIFTTHDLLLMDQDLFRRDEIWITERNAEGCSSSMSLSEFKDIRYDKDIRKSYLKGSFGGIPKILIK